MNHVLLIAGTRPNFMKIAPLCRALRKKGITFFLVHTGQHYDAQMSDVFFRELDIPAPDANLDIGSGERIEQTRKVVRKLLPIIEEQKPDAIVVVGDVLSTAAASIAAVATETRLVHIEAGLRSFNWSMPEELNRMMADHHADYHFVSDPSGFEHLKREGIPDERVYDAGNLMIDSLRYAEAKADASDALERLELAKGDYGLVTLHRAENVDEKEILALLLEALQRTSERMKLVFPMHPRTKKKIEEFGHALPESVLSIDPVGYLDMLALLKNARLVMTDSGGLQEEASVLGVPCLTLRTETERPITVTHGTNEVVGHDMDAILRSVESILDGKWKASRLPSTWDGATADRIAEILAKL